MIPNRGMRAELAARRAPIALESFLNQPVDAICTGHLCSPPDGADLTGVVQ